MKIQDVIEAALNAIQQSRNEKPVRPRSPPPSGGPSFGFEKDCFECGGIGHQRKDCDVYKKLLKENGGRRPKGHQGAFEKARAELRRKHSKARTTSRYEEAAAADDWIQGRHRVLVFGVRLRCSDAGKGCRHEAVGLSSDHECIPSAQICPEQVSGIG